jgi:hypothetical protein
MSMATGRVFNDEYPIEVDALIAEKLQPLIGTVVGIIGYVERSASNAVSWLKALDCKAMPNAAHANKVQFTGTVYGADLFSRTESQRQMGNVTMVIASRTVNAVAWRGAVTELRHEKVRREAVVTLKGRIRIREFSSGGNLMKTVELTCDQSADVIVHYVPPVNDNEFTFDEQPAAPTAAAPKASGRKNTRKAV